MSYEPRFSASEETLQKDLCAADTLRSQLKSFLSHKCVSLELNHRVFHKWVHSRSRNQTAQENTVDSDFFQEKKKLPRIQTFSHLTPVPPVTTVSCYFRFLHRQTIRLSPLKKRISSLCYSMKTCFSFDLFIKFHITHTHEYGLWNTPADSSPPLVLH